jgi:hypothetical protein
MVGPRHAEGGRSLSRWVAKARSGFRNLIAATSFNVVSSVDGDPKIKGLLDKLRKELFRVSCTRRRLKPSLPQCPSTTNGRLGGTSSNNAPMSAFSPHASRLPSPRLCLQRGATGITGLARKFRIVDDSGDG